MQGYEMTSKLKIWDHAMEMISYIGKFSINFVCYIIAGDVLVHVKRCKQRQKHGHMQKFTLP